jgi:RNA polymerase sigma-70 factor, ECF subfamily
VKIRKSQSLKASGGAAGLPVSTACNNEPKPLSLLTNRRCPLQLAIREEPVIPPVTPISDDLDQMFQAHHGLVFRTAYRITGNAADAEDVLQTVFLRMLRRDQAARALEKQESYFRRAAINVSLDVVRSGKDARSVPLDEVPQGDLPRTRQQPETGELREHLRSALARLNPREAEIFAMRFFEDLPNQEIARILGISQIHVAVILHRTRTRLQKELGSYLGERS